MRAGTLLMMAEYRSQGKQTDSFFPDFLRPDQQYRFWSSMPLSLMEFCSELLAKSTLGDAHSRENP